MQDFVAASSGAPLQCHHLFLQGFEMASKGWEMPSQPPTSTTSLNCKDQTSCDNANLVRFGDDDDNVVSLREWLDQPGRSVDAADCLHVFNQVAEAVGAAHAQSVVATGIRPSCFVVTAFKKVSFIESASCSGSGSDDPPERPMGPAALGGVTNFPLKETLLAEAKWYTSPEEASGGSSTYASDVYRLGVLLFELFCEVDSCDEKLRTMSNLRHRLLPPQMLIKWAKVASFCLWLLHPRQESRPKISEVRESELLIEMKDSLQEREDAIRIQDETADHELLLEFLLQLQQRKQEAADKLRDTILVISADIDEVANRKSNRCPYPELIDDEHSRKRLRTDSYPKGKAVSITSRLATNFKKLEAAYFSSRGRARSATTEGPRWVDPFLDGLCSYLAFSKLEARADLRQGDLVNSSNLVCSLAFDRDQDFFATAGVNRKIKIFEYRTLLDNEHGAHYPVVEMASKSRFSCICWNSYIKSQIASSDFEGVVQVWDVTRSGVILEMKEHERRIWSVDFSPADPTKLASGSDDGTVKLWNINQGGSVGSIATKANVCCVQFPPDSSHSIAVGSADHNVYCYDLRNLRVPVRTLVGHTKTVSYVKFVDSTTLVSASTDSSLKLWDLSASTLSVTDKPLETFTGHTNMKNFVGLSISDGYIATGSETNEVYVYHRAFPMPVLSYKFNCTDPISGREAEDAAQFVSCVCWRGRSSTLVAANSSGNIKILEMT